MLLALLAIIIANVLGGLSYYWIHLAIECDIPETLLVLLRNLFAVGGLALFMAMRTGFRARLEPREWLRLTLVAVFAYGLPLVLGNVGVHWSSPANASILVLLEPTAIFLFSWLLLKEHIVGRQIIGLGFGLIGAYCVIVGDPFDAGRFAGLLESRYLKGNLILAVHGVLWGLYSPVMKPLATRHRPIDLTFWVMLISMISVAPACLIETRDWRPGERFVEGLGYALVLAVLVSLGGTMLWNFSLARLRASTIAPFVFLQPIVGCLSTVWLLDKRLESGALVGAGLIAIAVLLVTISKRNDSRRPSPPRTDRPAGPDPILLKPSAGRG